MCLLAISQCISALLVLCTQPQSRNSCVLLSAAFFSTQQFDAVLSGITFATPIFTPAVTLLLPNLLPSSLLPPASSGCKYTRLHIKFEPQPLPLRKNVRISTGSRLYIFLDYSSWTSFILISFSFSPSWWICGCFSSFFFLFCTSGRVFQQTALPRVAEAALWLAAGEVYAPISSCTSTVALRKHLSWACSCSGTAWTSCCVTTLIARAHGEYSTDHNYRGGRERKWPQRKRQMGDTSESTLLRREVQKKNHFVYTKSVFLFSFFPVVSTLAPPPSSQTILIGLVKFQLP